MSAWPDLDGPVERVAPLLLGAVLTHAEVSVRITEVEAYGGPDDPGSHAHRGRTSRNASMFGPSGRLYCYFAYGMHTCCNVVVGERGAPAAVLVRAGEIVAGQEAARRRRPGAADRDLARGPGRLCRALGIGLEHDGTDLRTGPVRLQLPSTTAPQEHGPRVGLRLAADRRWRFWMPGEPTVSTYRKHPKADARHLDL